MDRAKLLAAALVLLTFSGCMAVGENFRSDSFSWIVQNKTSKADVYKTLGEPFRMGVDAGKITWTYGYYRYSLFGSSVTKDLVIYFDPNGTVTTYSFSTSFPEEKDQWRQKKTP